MADDLLAGIAWECAPCAPGAAHDPGALASLSLTWRPARVPGTAAGALRDGGVPIDGRDFDAEDWWFRCRFPAPTGPASAGTPRAPSGASSPPWVLHLGGLATLADVWVNGRHVLHSENMFTSHEVELAALDEENELVIRFGALVARLAERRPRPRWKSYLVGHQNLRWLRTTLLGRLPGWAATPAPVGPWRSLELRRSSALRALGRHVVASCDGDDGVVTVRLRLRGSASPESAVLSVAGHRVPLDVTRRGPDLVVEGELRLSGVERWWPATHGRQPLYSVSVEIGEEKFSLGRVGFRTVELGGDLGAFEVRVNGVPIFCRGAIWMPVDPVSMAPSEAAVRDALELMVTANMNMVRLPATGVYQDEVFWDTCDELGLLVWQDCMFAFVDPPNDPEFLAGVGEELEAVLTGLAGRPSLAVLCGGQEVAEQAAMLGTTRDKWTFPLLEEVIPEIARRLLPGTPYVTDNPFGGGLPFQMDAGVSHFFGIGGYLRPVEDARRAGVRFATECLAFAVAPEPETVDEVFGGPSRALDDPRWRKAVHHDAGRSWDMEDMQAHYLGRLFGVDPFVTRWQDAERYLELGRATVASLMTSVLTEWRRPGSPCTGGLILALRDLRPGPGWGLVDALGRPKAPWFALRRLFAPTALLMTDEGLNGLRLHLVNDTVQPLLGTVAVSLYARGELCVERGECPVELPARGGLEVDVADLFDGFRDLTAAYGFGRPAYDVVVAELFDAAGSSLSEVDYLPLGGIRPLEYDIGLEATARRDAGGAWSLEVATRRFAQWVAVDIPGFRAGDSWFHLPPGRTRTVTLRREPSRQPPVDAGPEGHVRALNCAEPTRIAVEHGP